jgi:hypothetical protein
MRVQYWLFIATTALYHLDSFAHADVKKLRSGSIEHVRGSGSSEMDLRELTGSKTITFAGNNGSPPENFPLQQCQGDWYVQCFSLLVTVVILLCAILLKLGHLPFLSSLFKVTLTMTVQIPWFVSNAPTKWSPGVSVLPTLTLISASIRLILFQPCLLLKFQDQLSHQ